jgi:hypothetical protein
MEEKSTRPSSTSPATSAPPQRTESWNSAPSSTDPKRDEAWRPRMEKDRERDLHGFGGKTPEADSILESPQIRDPEEDTAPLQGTKDRSDDDSLEPEE